MPMILTKFRRDNYYTMRDIRPVSVRVTEAMTRPTAIAYTAIIMAIGFVQLMPFTTANLDLVAFFAYMYFRWIFKQGFSLPFKFPQYANRKDPNNNPPGTGKAGKSEGILYLGNVTERSSSGVEMKVNEEQFGRELWLTNVDARTHILYLGTTGSGKTEGLKGLVTNSLTWGSGFVYIDGKADTDLWASLYALCRRFGRDDDLLVLNYMTGNSDAGSTSNSFNPFSTGSSSYLANMITNFMPDAGGDNAMWKERAVALMFSLMPALVYRRDHQGLLLDIGVVRDHIQLQPIIRMARDPSMPERVTHALQGYLNTLPGYVDAAFDDEGNERPPSPDQPMYDLQVARQQHGYLSMQFTRPLQMMADEYHYIFKAQLADVDMLDVVLNRRMLVVLVPALEKSGDEAANLGKIVAASLKGMMGATLGNTVEGSWEMAIGSKQTRSSNSFMTVFDEVGYYTAQGMAVMAAQARSLGFSLVFAAQDIPSMEKRVKQEAKSITANCNIKIIGKIEDPTDTADFINKHGATAWVAVSGGMSAPTNTVSSMFMDMPLYDDRKTASIQKHARLDYDHVRDQNEGEAHIFFGLRLYRARMFYSDPQKVKALRVHHFLPVPSTTSSTAARERATNELAARLKETEWTAVSAAPEVPASMEIDQLAKTIAAVDVATRGLQTAAALAVASIATLPAPAKKTEAPAEKAPKQLAAGNGKPKQPSAPKGDTIAVGALLAGEKPRSSGLPLYEGDQYAIAEIDHMPMMTETVAVPIGIQDSLPAGVPGVTVLPPSAPAIDTDLAVITHPDLGDDEVSVLEVELPVELAAMIEQSAKKLNKGLTGRDKQQ